MERRERVDQLEIFSRFFSYLSLSLAKEFKPENAITIALFAVSLPSLLMSTCS